MSVPLGLDPVTVTIPFSSLGGKTISGVSNVDDNGWFDILLDDESVFSVQFGHANLLSKEEVERRGFSSFARKEIGDV